MISFPMYAMRPFRAIRTEGLYTIVETARSRYVLDVESEGTTYWERRLQLLGDLNKPYPMYPLSQRVETVSQILLSKRRKFINVEGKLLHWKPTTFYPVVCLPIKSRWTTPTGKGGIEVQGLATKFIVSNNSYKYVQVIQVGNRNLLYDMCNDLRKPTRRKL